MDLKYNKAFGFKRKLITLPLKRQVRTAQDDNFFFYFYLSKKIRLDISCESSARINMKYQVLFSLKNNE